MCDSAYPRASSQAIAIATSPGALGTTHSRIPVQASPRETLALRAEPLPLPRSRGLLRADRVHFLLGAGRRQRQRQTAGRQVQLPQLQLERLALPSTRRACGIESAAHRGGFGRQRAQPPASGAAIRQRLLPQAGDRRFFAATQLVLVEA